MTNERKQKRKPRTLEQQIADLQERKDRDEAKARVVFALEMALKHAKRRQWDTALSHAEDAHNAIEARCADEAAEATALAKAAE